jgi:hypothetical protein
MSDFSKFPDFVPFKKIPRLNREILITEKIDGTNASVFITREKEIYAGKRTSWCTPENDNQGFAKWVHENKEELIKLGPGQHFGEWWGNNIQRHYDLEERRFSLFNVNRYHDNRPNCCYVVPILYRGVFSSSAIESTLNDLRKTGSVAAPGFMKAEGIVILHVDSNALFKVTLEKDEKPKQKEGISYEF